MAGVLGPYIVRPIEPSDIEGFFALAEISGSGFTSLQPDREYLNKYIAGSVSSFAAPDVELPQKFLLVMEEMRSGQIVGCAAVKTKIGHAHPFIDFEMLDARGKNVTRVEEAAYLNPADTFHGATEVGSLFVHPDHRMGGLGRYLAKSRYLLISNAPEVFSSPIIAELRGSQNEDGTSAFFDQVHKDRLSKTFRQADEFISHANDSDWKTIVPEKPILIESLSEDIRQTIAQPHATGMGAYQLLLREGFCDTGFVDLFDVGPIVAAKVSEIKTIQETVPCSLSVKGQPQNTELAMVSTTSLTGFRAVIDRCEITQSGVCLSVEAMLALGQSEGANVQYWAKSNATKTRQSGVIEQNASGRAKELY